MSKFQKKFGKFAIKNLSLYLIVCYAFGYLIEIINPDFLMMLALDAGAEDFADEEDSYEITTAPSDFDAVHKAIEDAGISMVSAEVSMIPQTYVTLTDEADITNIGRILDLLDDDDDVQEVYHNWEE